MGLVDLKNLHKSVTFLMQHMKKLIKKEYYNLMVLVTGNINSGVENVRRVYSGVS